LDKKEPVALVVSSGRFSGATIEAVKDPMKAKK
jgi:hypothetical protein